jgi:hypothetical protein
MLGYSSICSFLKTNLLNLFIVLSLIIALVVGCNEDHPVQPGETFDVSIISPQDSAYIFNSLQINLFTNSISQLKRVIFYIDEDAVVSDSLGNNSYLLDVSNFADDSFHKVRAVAINYSGASGYSNYVTIKISKHAKYKINLVGPASGYIERSDNKVELRWLNSRALLKTEIEISKNYFFSDLAYTSVGIGGKHKTPAFEAGLYYWRLKVEFKDTSLTLYSENRNFEIAGPLPPNLLSPTCNEITSGSDNLNFSWTSSQDAIGYDLLVLDDETKDTVIHTIINADSVFRTPLSISAYNWKMRAKNLAGVWGDWGPESRFGHGVFYKIVDAGAMLMPIQIKKSTDGNFLILGNAMPIEAYSYLTKISPLGQTLWSKRFDGTVLKSFEVLGDGSIIIIGEQTQIMPTYIHKSKVLKLDVSGNIIWESLLSEVNEFVSDIKPVFDGYIVAGSRIDSTNNKPLPMILRVSQTGGLIYRKLFGSDEPLKTKIFTDNTSVITLGYSSDQNNLLAFGKYDLLANELFKKNFAGRLGLRGAKKLSDESFLVGGFVNSGSGMFVKKINSSGDALMESEFNITGPCGIIDVLEYLTENYFVTGYKNSGSQENKIYLGKLDVSGNVLKEKQYPGESGYSIVSTDDGGILILGYINNGVMCIIKTNSDGTTFFPQ